MKFNVDKMQLDLLTLNDRYNYIGSITDKLIPVVLNKIGKYSKYGIYVDSSALSRMKLVSPNVDLSSKCGCLSFDKTCDSYSILLNEYCILTYYTATLNYTLLHELAHYVQVIYNESNFEKCYELVDGWKGNIMNNVEELNYNPTHKVNFSFRVARILGEDGIYRELKYGMMPKNHKPVLDPKRTILFDCTEKLEV